MRWLDGAEAEKWESGHAFDPEKKDSHFDRQSHQISII